MPDHRKRRVFLITAAVSAALIMGLYGLNEFRERERREHTARLLDTFVHAIATELNESSEKLDRVSSGEADGWRVLRDDEVRWLAAEVGRQNDVPSPFVEYWTTDVWGRPIRVAVRRRAGVTELRITSAGRDGRFETADDIQRMLAWVHQAATTPAE